MRLSSSPHHAALRVLPWVLWGGLGCSSTQSAGLPTAGDFASGPAEAGNPMDTAAPADDTAPDTALDSAHDSGDPDDRDGDGYAAPEDCDDGNPEVHPDAPEVCDNGLDDNCDGLACRWDGAGVLLSGEPGDSAGVDVAVGDVTGDGQPDVLVGAPDAVGGARAGTVWLWSDGMPAEDGSLGSTGQALGPDAAADGAGRTLLVAGDLSGDGYAELVVGTHHVPDAAPGRLAILLGPLDGTRSVADPDSWLSMPETLELMLFVAAGPVVDGQASLLVGAPREDGGVVRLLEGPWTGERALAEATVTWSADTGDAGRSMHAPGDLDGDGLEEVLIGVPERDEVVIFSAPWSDAVIEDADRVIRPSDTGDGFGTGITGAGDVDGDGRIDLLVAVAVGEADAGRVELFCGTELVACARFEGRTAGEQLGHELASPGDTEGDGFAEVALAGHGASAVGVWFGPVAGSHSLDSADATASFEGQAGFSMAAGGGYLALGAPNAGATDPPSGAVALMAVSRW